jgi:alpha-L-rhamnosidase
MGRNPMVHSRTLEMNSFNHYAYGAIGQWLYTYVAGIKIDELRPGYKHFFLAPHPGGGLQHARATFDSMYGTIRSSWRLDGEKVTYEFEIPANTTATVILPGSNEPLELGSGIHSF